MSRRARFINRPRPRALNTHIIAPTRNHSMPINTDTTAAKGKDDTSGHTCHASSEVGDGEQENPKSPWKNAQDDLNNPPSDLIDLTIDSDDEMTSSTHKIVAESTPLSDEMDEMTSTAYKDDTGDESPLDEMDETTSSACKDDTDGESPFDDMDEMKSTTHKDSVNDRSTVGVFINSKKTNYYFDKSPSNKMHNTGSPAHKADADGGPPSDKMDVTNSPTHEAEMNSEPPSDEMDEMIPPTHKDNDNDNTPSDEMDEMNPPTNPKNS